MKLAIIGHSVVHIRQHLFGQELARQGNEVLMLAPRAWGQNRAEPKKEGNWELKTFPYMGEDIFSFYPLGAEDAIAEFKPDWIIIWQEPGSNLCQKGIEWKEKFSCKAMLFTWENMSLKGGFADLPKYDLIVCGNDKAVELITPLNKNTLLLPQVGIPTDIFYDRNLPRNIDVAYIGRQSPEKGLQYLLWSNPVKVLPWTDYLGLPNRYSQCQIVVCPSVDVDYWREQAMPYIACEANACGTPAIVTDAGAIPFWHTKWRGRNPGVIIVPQRNITALRDAIHSLLNDEGKRESIGKAGQEWVKANLDSKVIAKELMNELG